MSFRHASVLLCAITLAAAMSGAIAQLPEPADEVPPFELGNLVLFPSRDFVTIEGFQTYKGENFVGATFLTEVVRGDKVVGAAWSVVVASDVAYEINHPGGYCWGDNRKAPLGKALGSEFQVTPEIVPGDKVRIKTALGKILASSTIQDVGIDSVVRNGAVLVVKGKIGSGVSPSQLEQRIINPDMDDTIIGRRDVRAVPGGFAASPNGGYESMMEVSGGTYTATYQFESAELAELAEAGGARLMSWEKEDGEANRQGLTIFELGETGGPGFGGCPVGPAQAAAPAGSFQSELSTDSTTMTFNWTKPEAAAGAAPLTGYSVSATLICTGPNLPVDGCPMEQPGVQKTINSATMLTATLKVDPSLTYTPSVRAMTSDQALSAPFKKNPITVPAPTTPNTPASAPPPMPLVTLEDGLVVFGNLPANAEKVVFYTIDKEVIAEDSVVADAKSYTGPFLLPEDAPGVVHFVVFTPTFDNKVAGLFTPPPETTVLPQPLVTPGTAGQEAITARWSFPDVNKAVSFDVELKKTSEILVEKAAKMVMTPVGKLERSATFTKAVYPELIVDTEYSFRVKANNGGDWSNWSVELKATKKTDVITLTEARWKAGKPELRLVVSASSRVNRIKLFVGNSSGPTTTTPFRTVLTSELPAPVSPSVMSVFDLNMRAGNTPSSLPAYIWAESECTSTSTSPCGGKASVVPRNGRKLSLRRL